MHKVAVLAVLLGFLVISANTTLGAGKPSECDQTQCVAGSAVSIKAVKGSPFFICPSLALADYTNFVLGVVAIGQILGGARPDISPETGEPIQTGATKIILDNKRQRAGAATFDEAAAKCKLGKSTGGLTVMNNSDDQYIWVGNSTMTFWAPKFSAYLTGKQ